MFFLCSLGVSGLGSRPCRHIVYHGYNDILRIRLIMFLYFWVFSLRGRPVLFVFGGLQRSGFSGRGSGSQGFGYVVFVGAYGSW